MKKNKVHIVYSKLLLIIFIAGQVVLYGHRHRYSGPPLKARSSSQHTISERCQLCDAMHLNHSVIDQQVRFSLVIPCNPVYIHISYDFVSIQLILSAGRAPPTC